MLKLLQRLAAVVPLMTLLVVLAPGARAGTVILEGSDAVGYHCALGQAGACTYRDELWTAIGGSDSRPIAVFGNTVNSTAVGSGTHTVDDFSGISSAGSLNNYVALYFLAGSGCCAEDDTLISGFQSQVASYLAGGGTVVIENYTGGSAWDFAVGAGGNGNANVAGVSGGFAATSDCSDGESVTSTGLLNGFVQPPPISCWTHQAYNSAFFGALGFTQSFFNSPVGYAAGDTTLGAWSSLLSDGSTVTVTESPEPASMAVLAMGLAGFGAIRRRRRRA